MKAVIWFCLIAFALYIGYNVIGDYVDILRVQAEAEKLRAQAEENVTAALRIQAEALLVDERADSALSYTVAFLAVMFALWGLGLGIGGVVVAFLAFRRREFQPYQRAAYLPDGGRVYLPAGEQPISVRLPRPVRTQEVLADGNRINQQPMEEEYYGKV